MSKDNFKSPQGIALHFSKRFQDNYPKEPLFEMMNDLSIAIHRYSQSQLSEYKQLLDQLRKENEELTLEKQVANTSLQFALDENERLKEKLKAEIKAQQEPSPYDGLIWTEKVLTLIDKI